MPDESASFRPTVTIGMRHYIDAEDRWVDREEITFPKRLARKFYDAIKRMDPDAIARMK